MRLVICLLHLLCFPPGRTTHHSSHFLLQLGEAMDQLLPMECEWKKLVPLYRLLHKISYMLRYHSFSVYGSTVSTQVGPGSQQLPKAGLL